MAKIKNLKKIDVKNKRVLVRVDFDVPIDEKGIVIDDTRIKGCLLTLEYLIKQKAKVILISHIGRPNGKKDKKLSLKPIAEELGKLLDKKILFSSEIFGAKAKEKIKKMKFGDILLLENIRFWKEEEENNQEFAKKIAELGDVYVNESFAVSHRKHVSIVGLPQFLPSVAGFLLEKETEELNKILNKPEKPLVAIIGGAKIETKIKVINKFLKIADKVLIGGALANTIFASQGIAMGESKVDKESFGEVKKINLNPPAGGSKIFLPIDLAIWDGKNVTNKDVGPLEWYENAIDIGSKTTHLFCDLITKAKTVVWNGPMGRRSFETASKEIVRAVKNSDTYSVAGGGDTITLINEFGEAEVFNWMSTGGGAMLDYLSEGTLPGIEALKD